MTTDHFSWALRYVDALGAAPVPLWTVHECRTDLCTLARSYGSCPSPGKHPRVRWRDLETADTEQIRDWWGRWPDAGIALLTGRRSGFDAIDVDPKNGGSIGVLRAARDGLPETPTVWTGRTDDGRRGAHFWIEWPGVDTSNGFDQAVGVPGIDYRGDGGLVVVPPTAHVSGVAYELATSPPSLIDTPAWLREHAERVAGEQSERDRQAAEVASRIAANPPPTPREGASQFGRYMAQQARDRVLEAAGRAGRPGGRHDTALRQARMLGGLIPTGHVTADYARTVVLDAARATVEGSNRDGELEDAVAWGLDKGREAPWEPEERAILVGKVTTVEAPPAPPQPAGIDLAEIVAAARAYLDLPDPMPLLAVLAIAATRDLRDEPVWLLLVGAPSGGKTEATRVLDDVADARLDDVSAAGMLSWKGGKKPAPVGVLTRVPDTALVAFGDLSTLLASSDRGGRDQTFALLRKVYDGHVARDLGNAPAPLVWQGRLTVVAAVTDAIDNYAAHADALGPRWLYLRLPARDTTGRRRAAAAARRGGLDAARDHLRRLATAAVRTAAARVNDTEVPDKLSDAIEDAALVCCWGRATVPRHGYGRREIDGLPIVEEPPRVIRQLRGLARGAIALGLGLAEVEYLCRRVALDSMPAARRHTLTVLADGERLTTAQVARAAGMHRHVARRQLEELEAVGVVSCVRVGDEPGDDDPDRRVATWQLDTADGALVARVIHADAAEVARKVGTHPPTPPIWGEEPTGAHPTLRATYTGGEERGAA